MAFDEPTSTIHQINQRLAALEAQVAYLSQALGMAPGAQPGGWPFDGQAGQPQPAMGVPVPSSGYGSLGTGGPADPSGGFPDVVQLARSGRKMDAIRLYRQYTNVGLKEAKAFVDSL
jgi:ribosomal protein L7/L12